MSNIGIAEAVNDRGALIERGITDFAETDALMRKKHSELTVEDQLHFEHQVRLQEFGVARDCYWLNASYDQILNHYVGKLSASQFAARAIESVCRKRLFLGAAEALPKTVRDYSTYRELKIENGDLREYLSQGRKFGKIAETGDEPIVVYVNFSYTESGPNEVVIKHRATPAGIASLKILLDEFDKEIRQEMLSMGGVVLSAQGVPLNMNGMRNRSWDDLVLSEDKLALLKKTMRFFSTASSFKAHGIPMRRNILLSGPPGCGKSTAVDAIMSAMSGVVKIIVLPSDIEEFHRSGKIISAIFRLAESIHSPCLIVWEDCETLLASRERGNGGTEFNAFLAEMDSCITRHDVQICCILTSNMPEIIDIAAKRRGRIDVQIRFDLPGPGERRKLFELFRGADVEYAFDLSKVVEATRGLNGADIKELVIRAKMNAKDRDMESARLRINEEDVGEAVEIVNEERSKLIGFRTKDEEVCA